MIIKYIKKKKNHGMEMLIDEYGGLIVSIVRKYLGSLTKYEDECVDDVLMDIWNNIDSFDENKGSFKNWIGIIAKYRAINYKKRYVNELKQKNIDDENIECSDIEMLQVELRDEIDSLLDRLSEEDKNIFIKYYIEDFSLKEICEETNLTESNVYSKMSRGRKKLRALYSKGKEI